MGSSRNDGGDGSGDGSGDGGEVGYELYDTGDYWELQCDEGFAGPLCR